MQGAFVGWAFSNLTLSSLPLVLLTSRLTATARLALTLVATELLSHTMLSGDLRILALILPL